MGFTRSLVALLAVALAACGARTELLGDHAPSPDASVSPDGGPRTGPDGGSPRDASSDAASPPSDAGNPPPDASSDAASPPSDAGDAGGADAGPPEAGPPDASVYCGAGDILMAEVCLRQTCENGDQGLTCALADGGVGHCLGLVCSNDDLLTDPENCGYIGGVCPSGQTCVGGYCTAGGAVVPCTDASCPAGYKCGREGNLDNGACDLITCGAGDDYHVCNFSPQAYTSSFPHFCCGSACVDLLDDTKNCGTCGHTCPGNALCLGGVCDVDCSTAPENTLCYDTYGFCCGGACVIHFNSDNANCNACGAHCPSGTSCRGGSCTGNCFDPKNACATGQACIAGPFVSSYDVCAPTSCQGLPEGDLCATTDADGEAHAGSCCGGACLNLEKDPQNCGGCGHACTAGAACVNGACTAPIDCKNASDSSLCVLSSGDSGQCCGGHCVDVRTDSGNCTGCHLTCPTGSTCRAVPSEQAPAQCLDLAGAPAACSNASSCPTGFGCDIYKPGLCDPVSCTGAADGSPCYSSQAEPYNMKCCGGLCTNLSLDNDNCGQCGAACPNGTTCESQACFVPHTATQRPCSLPGSVCPAGTLCSSHQCLPTTCAGRSNADRCALASGATGTCCAGTCTDPSQDTNNCGECGAGCNGQLCVKGVCENIDASSCSPACPSGTVCHQGVCYGPVCGDQSACIAQGQFRITCGSGPFCAARDGKLGYCCDDGSCVEAASDPQNCGACGVTCAAGKKCSAGECR
jgi:hypothetical protein